MECKVVIPSRKRANILCTEIKNSILVVAKNELETYKEKFPDREIICHPDLSNLAKIRQWIYEKFGSVFMVDDDIVSVERMYRDIDKILTQKEIYSIIQEAAYISKNIGASLFGFNNDPIFTHYNQHKPFMLIGYINGCAIGLHKDKNLFFNEKTTACESHWINLLNAYYNRFCFIDKRFHFKQKTNSTFTLEGGQTGKRTMLTEKRDTLLLKKYFGDSVKLKKQQNKTKQLHPYQRQIDIRL